MRVLDTFTGEFAEIDPRDRKVTYAILSHTWDSKGEQTHQELREIQKRCPPSYNRDLLPNVHCVPTIYLYTSLKSTNPIWADAELSPKIREACRVACEDGYRYLWIDSCCIDKTSSSELSESINSMYQWYALADICYAFLADVPPGAEEDHTATGSRFRRSRWFTRGWTLQELIAPSDVIFLAKDWKVIGSKHSDAQLITEITGIDSHALLHTQSLEEFSIAQRFSWAAKRVTTREEDRAYSLLGILDINMPTLYGEGERAFRRLQEEIMRRTPDQSLFAWSYHRGPLCSSTDSLLDNPETPNVASYEKSPLCFSTVGRSKSSLLAPSLSVFRECEGIKALSHDEVLRRLQLTTDDFPTRHYDFTPYGIRVELPVINLDSSNYFPRGSVCETDWQTQDILFSQWYLVILGCEHRDFPGRLLGRVCYIQSSESSVHFLYSGYIQDRLCKERARDLLLMPPQTMLRLRDSSHIFPRWLYIPQPAPHRTVGVRDPIRNKPHKKITLILGNKTRNALSAQGYTATLRGPDDFHPATHSVTVAHDTHTINISYQHTLREEYGIASDSNREQRLASDQRLVINAYVETSGGVHRDSPTSQGTGTLVSWRAYRPWEESLQVQDIELETPKGSTLSLGLDFVATNHYRLSIELKRASLSSFFFFDPVNVVYPAPNATGRARRGQTTPSHSVVFRSIGASISRQEPL